MARFAIPVITIVLILTAAAAEPLNLRSVGAIKNSKIPSPIVNASASGPGVLLDVNSTSQTDTLVQSSATARKTFRVGVILNASSANPLNNVWGWQFFINYTTSIVVPQGDPSASTSYPDGASSTSLFGAQTTAGTVSWAAKVAVGQAFGIINTDSIPGSALVALTLLPPAQPVSISAKTLLANVAFELVNKTSTPVTFSVSNVLLVDQNANPVCTCPTGPTVTVAVSNYPPHASFTVTKTAQSAYVFNASASFDLDSIIPNPAGYFWDFGDGTQDLGITGPIVTHDYGPNGTNVAPGSFNATLRVADALGATGSARDQTGNVIVNSQPSHAYAQINAVPPDFSLSLTPGQVTLVPGTPNDTGAFKIRLSSINGFEGSVGLTADISPIGGGLILVLTPGLVVIGGGGSANATLSVQAPTSTAPGSYTITITGDAGPSGRHQAAVQVIVTQPSDLPPVASFTWTPTNPAVGDQVDFDGSGSSDPDGFVSNWSWNFGDGTFNFVPFPFVQHAYSSPGNYTVYLTVTDNAGLTGAITGVIQVHSRPVHDVAIDGIFAPSLVVQTQQVGITVLLRDLGQQTENVTLTTYYDHRIIASQSGITLFPQNYDYYVNFVWDTSNVAPGNYTISATVFLPTDQNPANNNFTLPFQVTVLPPPTLTLSPSTGTVGTKVTIIGSGFLPVPYYPSEFFVTFDDMFMGLSFATNGKLNFTLNIPISQPGTHSIKALDIFSGTRATSSFIVVPEHSVANSIDIVVDAGSVYFPGDTAVAYLRVTLNGAPLGSMNLKLQASLLKPDGTKVNLNATLISPGLFKSLYKIPTRGSLGTYALLVRGQLATGQTGSSLSSFEVKPTWIQAHSQTIASATAIAGLVGVLGVAWWRGYFGDTSGSKRKRGENGKETEK